MDQSNYAPSTQSSIAHKVQLGPLLGTLQSVHTSRHNLWAHAQVQVKMTSQADKLLGKQAVFLLSSHL